jgi:hypothetical protein
MVLKFRSARMAKLEAVIVSSRMSSSDDVAETGISTPVEAI